MKQKVFFLLYNVNYFPDIPSVLLRKVYIFKRVSHNQIHSVSKAFIQ